MKFKELHPIDLTKIDLTQALRTLAALGLDTDWTQARPLYERGVRYAPLAVDVREEWRDIVLPRPPDTFFETHPEHRHFAHQRDVVVPKRSWHIVIHLSETTP